MERVKKGETYWWIRIYDGIEVCADVDWRKDFSTKNFNDGNYFHTKEETEAMARKIKAVLKGADVIETPSEEEISQEYELMNTFGIYYDSEDYREGYKDAIDFIKSKIVK